MVSNPYPWYPIRIHVILSVSMVSNPYPWYLIRIHGILSIRIHGILSVSTLYCSKLLDCYCNLHCVLFYSCIEIRDDSWIRVVTWQRVCVDIPAVNNATLSPSDHLPGHYTPSEHPPGHSLLVLKHRLTFARV